MSIVLENELFCMVDHVEYINMINHGVASTNNDFCSYQLLPKLFSIVQEQKKINEKRKRSHNSEILIGEASDVKEVYHRFLSEVPEKLKHEIKQKYKVLPTSDVRDLSRQLFEATTFEHKGIKGVNTLDVSLECNIMNETFLIPPHSRFLCGCVREQCERLEGTKYDIIIADPPWWNKYIRRLKSANQKLSYSMMYNEDIASIPVKNLLSENCLVAVWCTNSPSNTASVKELIFPSWGVEYVATWYWLKVTVDLEPICEFGVGSKKQPYERLILGKVGDVKPVPDGLLLVSVPSALHSHKPPLLDVLSRYINENSPQTLELFARYLLPNTTSIGYEPLKWQHISLYETVKSINNTISMSDDNHLT